MIPGMHALTVFCIIINKGQFSLQWSFLDRRLHCLYTTENIKMRKTAGTCCHLSAAARAGKLSLEAVCNQTDVLGLHTAGYTAILAQ